MVSKATETEDGTTGCASLSRFDPEKMHALSETATPRIAGTLQNELNRCFLPKNPFFILKL